MLRVLGGLFGGDLPSLMLRSLLWFRLRECFLELRLGDGNGLGKGRSEDLVLLSR